MSEEWEATHSSDVIDPKTRMGWLRTRLAGHRDPKLFNEIRRNNSPHYAYPDVVCMAVIEYFAFEARTTNAVALQNYRDIASHGLRTFIYEALGYTRGDNWKYFRDRVSILRSRVPVGYFSIFREIADMVVDLINAGLTVSDKTIPDISVGQHWAAHWAKEGLGEKLGERVEWCHVYPDYYPQARSNPQFPWAYPDKALPEFREWFRSVYLPRKFPRYILGKAESLKGGADEAARIAGLYEKKQIVASDT